jgi:dienelactone hydrolase
MAGAKPTRAPQGELVSYARERFDADDFAHDIYRKGTGPAVIVITEMPGITPHVLGFADRVVALGCTAVLPDLFGEAGRDPYASGKWGMRSYGLRSAASVCISREFSMFVTGVSSPVVCWLRSLAAREHVRCGGPGVGAIGMCFSGGFALAMATDPRVLAPVLSQPSLPIGLSRRHRAAIDCSDRELAIVAQRCANEGLRVLGVRFHDDPLSPGERFAFLKQRLGDGFVAIELDQASGHPDGPLPRRHSVLTGDLIDEPGEPTQAALDRVLELFRSKLLVPMRV